MFNLSLFGKKDYDKSLVSVMGVFSKAQKQAEELITRMNNEISSNNDSIKALQDRNAQIEKTRQGTQKFVNNLDKLLKV